MDDVTVHAVMLTQAIPIIITMIDNNGANVCANAGSGKRGLKDKAVKERDRWRCTE